MAEVFVLSLCDWPESDVARYLSFASTERQDAVARFRFASDKNRSLWTELFARWCIAQAVGKKPRDVSIAHDEKGKPFCPGTPVSVSLSHSGAYIAVAVGQNAVGVDVERRRKMNLSVSERWFRPKEHALLLSLSENDCARTFLRFWTLKEAALKYSGKGLSGGLENVDCLALLDAEGNGSADDLAGQSFSLDQEAVVSIVAQRSDLPPKARHFHIEHSENGIYGNACFAEQPPLSPFDAPET